MGLREKSKQPRSLFQLSNCLLARPIPAPLPPKAVYVYRGPASIPDVWCQTIPAQPSVFICRAHMA